MKNFIVRVYRNDQKDMNKIAGIVENVDEESQENFSSMRELMRILCGGPKKTRPG